MLDLASVIDTVADVKFNWITIENTVIKQAFVQ